ncbi:MAG: multidrug transporter subunit MdtD [Candidatus Dactylopiibacterium sp.]|nr:multidrug transporter subunit MdtD [Candidatus Dactylopiibacterium sp.]
MPRILAPLHLPAPTIMTPQPLPPTPLPPRSPAQQPLLWLIAIGLLMQMLDSTIVNTALPAIARDLNASPLKMETVVISYMLTVALLMPASGWLADRFGIRRIYLLAIALFTLGSVLCAYSQTLGQLVASRVVQGVGGAMLMPVGRLAILRTATREELLAALSFIVLPAAIGPLLGPFLGGWLAERFSWHWIFLINVPIGLLGLALTLRIMPPLRAESVQPFDWLGFGLFAAGIMLVSLALEGLGELGWAFSLSAWMLIVGAGLLTSYWLHAMRASSPLFPPDLFRINSFAVGILGNLFARLGSGGVPFLLPLMLQLGLHYTPTQAGLMLVPMALAALVARLGVGKLVSRFGYRRLLTVNTLIVGILIASFASVAFEPPMWLLLVQLALLGYANGLQFTLMNTVTLLDLDGAHASSGNSLLSVTMQLSMSLGVAASAALLGGFARALGETDVLEVFPYTFLSIGVMGMVAAAIFLQLQRDSRSAGREEVADL